MKDKPIILGIETALRNGSLSILEEDREIASYGGQGNIARSENLLQAINLLLNDNELTLKDVDLLAVSTGPGSFTGIRAGIATAQALVLGLNCQHVGVSVLDAISSFEQKKTQDATNVISIIPSGRTGQYIWQSFSKERNSESVPELGTIDDFVEHVSSNYKTFTYKPLLIVVEFSLAQEIGFAEYLKKENNLKSLDIIYASDNVAKLIALQGNAYLKNNRLDKSLSYPPKYFWEVEIGKTK